MSYSAKYLSTNNTTKDIGIDSRRSSDDAVCNKEGVEGILENIDGVSMKHVNFDETSSAPEQKQSSFANLLRHSKFMQLGDFDGCIVVGKVVNQVANDIYIDFGLKFNAVCKILPSLQNEKFVIGSNVLIRLHNPELSQQFLGSTRDLTLLEADATLIRLYN
ncbi:unnamed protein product [Anisakis simplex]|uniref:28S ribosomal protein S28, mitochondrial (inferred by orthology to a human protein) n=1 Tax=Anisakis simplex TaxID=6269 RepID=A0A0M3K3R4_ANISI|nr:unnamed protein product [Anisakis simplex]